MVDTYVRKGEHLKIVAEKNVAFRRKNTGFDDVDMVYQCLPEIDMRDIDVGVEFLGKKLSAPIMVSGMTGGVDIAEQVNRDIAMAAEALELAMGLGSQRAMIENPELLKTYHVRDIAPKILLVGNIGASHIKKYSITQLEKMVSDVGADALAIHINPAQECMQLEGDTYFEGMLEKINEISRNFSKPVYVKEVGHG